MAIRLLAFGGHRDLFGHGPHTAYAFTSNRNDDQVRMFAAGNQAARALAQPDLGLPADVLDGLGLLFEPPLEGATDCGGIARGPRPCDERAPGMGMTGFAQGSLPAPLSAGVF